MEKQLLAGIANDRLPIGVEEEGGLGENVEEGAETHAPADIRNRKSRLC